MNNPYIKYIYKHIIYIYKHIIYIYKRFREAKLLRSRWKDQNQRIRAIIDDVIAGKDWTKNLLSSEENGWDEIELLSTCPSSFHLPGDAAPRDLRGLSLDSVVLTKISAFAETCFDYCVFNDVVLNEAILRGASFQWAIIKNNCYFDSAQLQHVNFQGSICSGVSMTYANLSYSNLRGANFEDCILKGSILLNVVFEDFTQETVFKLIRGKRSTKMGGIHFRNELGESDFAISKYYDQCIHRLDFENRFGYFAKTMRCLTNYGYSPIRVIALGAIVWVFFGLLYMGLPLHSSLNDTKVGDMLCSLKPEFDWNGNSFPKDDWEPFFLSITTMTTIGGSARPINLAAQIYMSIELFFSYVILALFVSAVVQRMTSI